MNSVVKYTGAGCVAVIQVDNPPVNDLSPAVPEAIFDAIES